METIYVSLDEFIAFKREVQEKINRSEEKDIKIIRAEEKIEYLTEMVIDGFDLFYDRLNV